MIITLRRIKNSEWALPAILNYSLLSYLLKNNNTHVKDIAKALWEYKSKTHPRNILFNYINTDEKQLKIFYSEIYLSFNKNANWIKILFDNEYNKPKIWTKNSKNSEFAVL